ncbi:MAG: ATP synthase F1 subunit delta [Vicinamibacterales bacterium]
MTPRAAARPYASALFEVTDAAGRSRASEALQGLADLVTGNADLRKVIDAPSVSAQAKRQILEALIAAAGDVPSPVGRLVLLLADQDDLALLPAVAEGYAARVRQAQNVIEAEVVTAVPLDETRRRALAEALGRATGGTVTIRDRVDPAIVGGLVARVGSTVFDGSVARQLERLRQRLLVEA